MACFVLAMQLGSGKSVFHFKPLCGKEEWKYGELEDELGVVEKRRIFCVHLRHLYGSNRPEIENSALDSVKMCVFS